jgi:transposase
MRPLGIGRKNSYDHYQGLRRTLKHRLQSRQHIARCSRSGWVRAPEILDGCSNSCPGIGYPMVTMRRKAASIWLRT